MFLCAYLGEHPGFMAVPACLSSCRADGDMLAPLQSMCQPLGIVAVACSLVLFSSELRALFSPSRTGLTPTCDKRFAVAAVLILCQMRESAILSCIAMLRCLERLCNCQRGVKGKRIHPVQDCLTVKLNPFCRSEWGSSPDTPIERS